MKKVLLYSGGMDSWLIDKLWKPDIRLYVNMHTEYSTNEISKLQKDVIIIDFPLNMWERTDSIIPLRNLYLLMIACNYTMDEDIELCYGATFGDRSKDQSEKFQLDAEALLNYLYLPQSWIPNGKKIKIITSFQKLTKREMLEMYIEQGGTLDECFEKSLSCYHPNNSNKPCWNCKPCFRKFVAFDTLGYEFNKEVIRRNMIYAKDHILPELSSGIYRCPEEDKDVRAIISKYKELI